MDEARLAGLPAHAKAAARRGAEAKGLAGWRFTLHMPSLEPFMTYLADEALRRELWTASAAVGAIAPQDNAPLIGRILTLRAEKAALLSKAHFADLVLERRMAKTGAGALGFMEDMEARAKGAFVRECRELEEFKAQQTGGRWHGWRRGKSSSGRKNSGSRATVLTRKSCGPISRWIG